MRGKADNPGGLPVNLESEFAKRNCRIRSGLIRMRI